MSLPISVAVLIDGGFFLKRYYKVFPNSKDHTAAEVAKNLYTVALKHVGNDNFLFRIFYYDCYPISKRVHHPITGQVINFEATDQAKFRLELFEELKKKRKVALRMGSLRDTGSWLIKPTVTKELLNGRMSINDVTENDVFYELHQKGLDIKIGLDVAALAFKKQVQQIVLISGDADFVSASKLARREGIDFVLDPMWNPIDDTLFEHIDGLRSTCPKPNQAPFEPGSGPTPREPGTGNRY